LADPATAAEGLGCRPACGAWSLRDARRRHRTGQFPHALIV